MARLPKSRAEFDSAVDLAAGAAYRKGIAYAEHKIKTEDNYQRQLERERLELVRAITELIKSQNQALSKAGYLLGKLDGKNGF